MSGSGTEVEVVGKVRAHDYVESSQQDGIHVAAVLEHSAHVLAVDDRQYVHLAEYVQQSRFVLAEQVADDGQ